jgi:hypothetical protein
VNDLVNLRVGGSFTYATDNASVKAITVKKNTTTEQSLLFVADGLGIIPLFLIAGCICKQRARHPSSGSLPRIIMSVKRQLQEACYFPTASPLWVSALIELRLWYIIPSPFFGSW